MMKQFISAAMLVALVAPAKAQTTFKCGWDTYKVRMIVHEYTYSYTTKDSTHLYLADSTKTFVSSDSMAMLTVDYPFHDNIQYKTATHLGDKKKPIKVEEFKNDNLENLKEYRYDDKGRKVYMLEDNKLNGNTYKKTYDFSTDKKTGDFVINEVSYFNGRIEFYTRSYYDKNSVLYKEIKLNDNNKDLVHEETFKYGANGKVKERRVYFNEFKVTKTFPETAGEQPAKCYRTQSINITDKPTLATKVTFLKKLIAKNKELLLDGDCHEFEYKFTSPTCEVIFSTVKGNIKQAVIRIKQPVAF